MEADGVLEESFMGDSVGTVSICMTNSSYQSKKILKKYPEIRDIYFLKLENLLLDFEMA